MYVRVAEGGERSPSDASPSPVDNQGKLVPKDTFRQFLERNRDIGNLEALLGEVLGNHTSRDELDRLLDAVVTVCRGAYAFGSVDWRTGLRNEDARLKAKIPAHRIQLRDLISTLTGASVRLPILTGWFERKVEAKYGRTFALPFPSDATLLELLELVEAGLASAESRLGMDSLPHVRQHGCLDYGRSVPPKKFRDPRQMLGFNLVFLFRAATGGPWAVEGTMPKNGRPRFDIAARLVAATLDEFIDGAPATYSWLQSTIRSITRDNPNVTLVPWPTSTDEVGIEGWFVPSVYDG